MYKGSLYYCILEEFQSLDVKDKQNEQVVTKEEAI